MSWTEIGAIGELIGAIGLFISISFVAYEMQLKRGDEQAREYESLRLKAIELNFATAQSPVLSDTLSKWWQQTDGMWGEIRAGINKETIDKLFQPEEKTMMKHYWQSWVLWLDLALAKEERHSFDSSNNRKGFSNIIEYARIFGAMDNGKLDRLSKQFN